MNVWLKKDQIYLKSWGFWQFILIRQRFFFKILKRNLNRMTNPTGRKLETTIKGRMGVEEVFRRG